MSDGMLASEAPHDPGQRPHLTATPDPRGGLSIDGFYPGTIVSRRDGSLITESGLQSTDGGRSWARDPAFTAAGGMGLVRLSTGELGAVAGDWDMPAALGNAANHWYFRWSGDEGCSWSEPVQITLPGLTMGLPGTIFVTAAGRVVVATYSQFLGSRFDLRGASWGTYRGARFPVETEGHFPLNEVCRVYCSDDSGRSWTPCDGWIMGWRDQRWSDAITEPDLVELQDGRIALIGRTLTGRLYRACSEDGGHSWWPGARPTDLAASYSPGRICRLPGTGDLLVVWNQCSRAEIRAGLRRGRLSCAVSRDEGESWNHFRNLEAIACMADATRVTAEPDFTPVWGDDEVGTVPDDYANFHYPNVSVAGDEVFISYAVGRYEVIQDAGGMPQVQPRSGSRTRILPESWFYD